MTDRARMVEAAAAQLLAPFGVSEVAIAFAARHPAVTSVIVGPATISQLDGCVRAGVLDLPEELLDLIDGLVAPGSMVNHLDAAWSDLSLKDASLRRR